MILNADFSRAAIVLPKDYQWVNSPQAGVDRMPLDRLGGEKARATSIVRYAPDSFFPQHKHPGGEEIFVLSGTFSEDHDDYPAGWYLRNPPGSSHRPSSQEGAIIFVKLGQMELGETGRVRINTQDPASWQRVHGRDICRLFSSHTEQVSVQRLEPGKTPWIESAHGAEILVLAGQLATEHHTYDRCTWMRLPSSEYEHIVAGANGATIYLKTGHLPTPAKGA